jgi:hypothetical protein
MTALLRLAMPGKVWSDFVEGSAVSKEEAWPAPTWRKVGHGHQAVYWVTPAQRDQILSHVRMVADALSSGVDPETAADARYAHRWLEREEGW